MTMPTTTTTIRISLNQIRIASPCTALWEDMEGDERSRFCTQCRLNVYNLSAMSQAEAQTLISEKEGRLCVRLYKRADGTVITRDCPVGLAAIRRRTAWMLGRVAAGFVLLASGMAWAVDYANPYRDRRALSAGQPWGTLTRWLHEPEPIPLLGRMPTINYQPLPDPAGITPEQP